MEVLRSLDRAGTCTYSFSSLVAASMKAPARCDSPCLLVREETFIYLSPLLHLLHVKCVPPPHTKSPACFWGAAIPGGAWVDGDGGQPSLLTCFFPHCIHLEAVWGGIASTWVTSPQLPPAPRGHLGQDEPTAPTPQGFSQKRPRKG